MADKEIVYDIEGYEILTTALMSLINQYPDLGEDLTFNSMSEDEGITMYPTAGAVVISERTDVTGTTEQKCNYPFMVIYRASGLNERNRIRIKEMLDTLGKWLEKQPVTINESPSKLESYPPLTGGREITLIKRTSPAYLYDQKENRTEEWSISLQAEYLYTFER